MNSRHTAKAPSPSRLLRLPDVVTDPARWLYILVGLLLAYLVIPPVGVIIWTSLIAERGPEAGSPTFQHYASIFASLSDFRTLIWNTFVFSSGVALEALILGTSIAWLVERTNVPFRNLAYISAFISFGMPVIVNVIGWILLLGPKAGLINVAVRDLTGIYPIFNLFSMPGMIFVEALLWTPLVFLLMATPFRSMDPSLEEAAVIAGSSNWQVFRRVTFRLALPSALAVLILTSIRAVESFEIPALVGLPAGIEVLTTKILLETRGGFLPTYGVASAYSIILIALVVLCLFLFHRVTGMTYSFATVTGKGYRPRRIDLGRWRWPAGFLPPLTAPPPGAPDYRPDLGFFAPLPAAGFREGARSRFF